MFITENISNGNNLLGRRKAIEELEKGREFANKLRVVINGGDGGVDGEQLVEKVLMSFTNSLLILNKNPSSNNCDEVCDVPSSCGINPTKSEDSLESNCKSSVHKERRGCYKRRRTSQVLEKESEAPIDDGHQWRKYGQKVILNTKHPRNYYRCTHKYDQGCLATKQVQQVEDEPTLYKTTYYGNHTCRNTLNPTIILDDSNDSPSQSSMFLSFDNSLPTKQECPIFLSSSSLVIKKEEEFKEEDLNNNNNNVPSCSSNDYMISSELTFDNYSTHHHVNALSSTLDSDDVISYDPSHFDDAIEFLCY
ncbi:hypothetical protein HN51_066845 [Arachis hypogaea]|uniref:WRKY domain-containing protein n=1 Tax=Arachis hypogaea TaxID=3818 RepID=A0A444ZKW7_ARAHY|nr:probable WRKY transcription factor 70 [Arachis ipaensis]XP_025649021.1 WRKY DNA-binding transcription factor 70 [Arachis hypogaea]QHO08172.1 putative WRKY transcription factor [Arachis hypogaea]RYR14815.1 hypothetical protein Ahy_B04g071517 [Arachis hypogaea]